MRPGAKWTFIHRFFLVSIIVKGIDGVLESIGGLLLLFFSHHRIVSLVTHFTRHELGEDPSDFLANYLTRTAQSLSMTTQTFVAVYFLAHGIIKVGLVVALLKRKLWAYPLAMGVFLLFIMYQQYRYSITHSLWMPALSLLDFIVIMLTWLEYRHLKRSSRPAA
jgi:uncharacterized membrane protein